MHEHLALVRILPMDTLKGHNNKTIQSCQERDEPTDTKKNMEFLRTQRRRFLRPKLSMCACTLGMCSVNAIMATAVARINSRGWKL